MPLIQGPLSRAIAQQSAEYLEANYPNVYDALGQELQNGLTLSDVKKILRRTFGYDLREAFALRVLQAAEFMFSEQVNVSR